MKISSVKLSNTNDINLIASGSRHVQIFCDDFLIFEGFLKKGVENVVDFGRSFDGDKSDNCCHDNDVEIESVRGFNGLIGRNKNDGLYEEIIDEEREVYFLIKND